MHLLDAYNKNPCQMFLIFECLHLTPTRMLNAAAVPPPANNHALRLFPQGNQYDLRTLKNILADMFPDGLS